MPIYKKIISLGQALRQYLKRAPKNVFQLIKSWSWRRRLVIGVLATTGLSVGLIGLSLIVNYILISPVEMNLARLQESIEKEPVCHEDCAQARQVWEKDVSGHLSAGTEPARSRRRLNNRLEKYFFSSRVSLEFKLEIIKLYAQASAGQAGPPWLIDYLSYSHGDPELQGRILVSFVLDSWPSDFLFSLLASERPLILKREVVRVLSSYPAKEKLFQSDQLAELEEIIFSADSDPLLRSELVRLLSDYYWLFPELTERLLEECYNPANGLDNISRLYAADVLNSFRSASLSEPEVSEAEWEEYFNQ
jgi:hypothetical protein